MGRRSDKHHSPPAAEENPHSGSRRGRRSSAAAAGERDGGRSASAAQDANESADLASPRDPSAADPEPGADQVSTVAPNDAGARLDRFLAQHLPAFSRARLQALIRAGAVTRDGTVETDLGRRVRAGETYIVRVPPPEPAAPEAQAIPLAIVYEDKHLIVIDKPKGLTVHPAPGHASGTLVNALIAHCGDSLSGIGGVMRPGIVHRLDKDTTGLMVAAKTDAAHRGLSEQFAAHGRDGRLERSYRAIVWGAPDRPRGTVSAALSRSAVNRTKIAVVAESRGRHAVTRYEVLDLSLIHI